MKRSDNAPPLTSFERAHRYGLSALALALPLFFYLGLNDTFDLPKLALVYIAVSLLLPWIVAQHLGRAARPLRLTGAEGALLFFAAAIALSTYYSIDKDISVMGFYRVHVFGFLPMTAFLALFWISAQDDAMDVLPLACMVGGAAAGFYAVLQVTGLEPFQAMPRVTDMRAWSSLGNPIFLGAVAMMALAVTLGEFGRPRYDRVLLSVLAAGQSAGLLLSLSRSAWVGSFVAVLFLAVVQKRKKLLGIMAGLCVASLLVLPSVRQRATTLFSGTESSNAARLQGWLGAFSVWKEYPLHGSGPDTFFEAFRPHRSMAYIRATGTGVTQAHAHNDFLQIAATLGTFGLCGFLVLVIMIAWRVYVVCRQDPKGPGVPLAAACLALLVQDQFNFSSVTTTAWACLVLGQLCRTPDSLFVKRKWPALVRSLLFFSVTCASLSWTAAWAAAWRADACFKQGLEEAGQPVLALVSFRESIRWRPDVEVYQTALGNTDCALAQMAVAGSLRKDLFQEAWKAAQTNTRRHPQNPDAWNNQGVVAMWRAQLDGEPTMPAALAAFVQASHLDPLFVDAWANQAKWHHLNGDLAGEKTLWEKVLTIDPAHPMAHAVLGR